MTATGPPLYNKGLHESNKGAEVDGHGAEVDGHGAEVDGHGILTEREREKEGERERERLFLQLFSDRHFNYRECHGPPHVCLPAAPAVKR